MKAPSMFVQKIEEIQTQVNQRFVQLIDALESITGLLESSPGPEERTRHSIRQALKKTRPRVMKHDRTPLSERTVADWAVRVLTEASEKQLPLAELTARMQHAGWASQSKTPTVVVTMGLRNEMKHRKNSRIKRVRRGIYRAA